VDLQEQLALLGAGQNSGIRKAGENPLVEQLLQMNSDKPPLNINVDLDQDQVKSIGGDYSTPLFGGDLNVGGTYTLPSAIDDPFMGPMQIPGNTQLNAGWRNKNVGLNVNYGTGGPTIQSEFGASF
jgi:hypothetical protein